MSIKKTFSTILLGIILFLMVSYLPAAMADCSCSDGGCRKLTVQVLGYGGYVVHDELVMIRYFGGNESSPVLYENRSVEGGITNFCIEDGEYWVDVRNIWEHIVIDDDTDFVFPYLLFDDVENSDNKDSIDNGGDFVQSIILWLGIVVVIIAVMLLGLLIIEKKKKKKK